jgi:hypothetical protein
VRITTSTLQGETDFSLSGSSPRKQDLTAHIVSGFDEYGNLMKKSGVQKIRKSCLYINSLDDVNMQVLEELVDHSVTHMKKFLPAT